MHFIEAFVVDQAPAVAFAYAADFRNLPAWDPSITAVELVTPEPVAVGSRFTVRLTFLGLPSELSYEVLEWEPGRRAVLRAENLFVTATDTVEVEPQGHGSRVTWDARIDFVFPVSLADPLLSAAFRSNVTAAVRGLRRGIQAQAPPPQPGPEG